MFRPGRRDATRMGQALPDGFHQLGTTAPSLPGPAQQVALARTGLSDPTRSPTATAMLIRERAVIWTFPRACSGANVWRSRTVFTRPTTPTVSAS